MSISAASAAAPVQEAHLRDYWKIVWQGRWTVAGIFLFVVGVAALWTFLSTPIYQATCTVEVQPQANRLAAGTDVSGLGVAGYGWFAEEKYHNTQVEIIRSRDLAARVVDDLKLREHPQFKAVADPVAAFRARVVAIPRRDTALIEISMTGTNPEDVAAWVNAVGDAYVQRNLERAEARIGQAISGIQKQMEDFQVRLPRLEAARFAALGKSSTFSSEDQVEIIHERLREYNAELNKSEIEMNRLRDLLARIRDMQLDSADLLSVPELADDAVLKELNQQRVKLELELESAKVALRPGHQTYQKTVSELAKVRQRVQDRMSTILGTLQNRYDLRRKEADYLRQEIRAGERISVEVAEGKSLYDMKKTEADTTRQVFDMIQKTISDVRLGLDLLQNNVAVLDEATVPRAPIKPRKLLNLLVASLCGLFAGVGAAFFLDYLDNTFRTPDDVEKQLGLSVLGLIPRIGDDGVASRAVTEAYQSLRTSVIFSSKNHRRRVILITSTGPQEGKSSTAAEVARTLAAGGDRVVIVDCDLRRPVQHAIHKLDRDLGLTNYLAAPLDASPVVSKAWASYVRPTATPNLSVITCGPIPPSPPDLLGSERFIELLTFLRESFDWVLLDSPPAATLADSPLLASTADMVVLVIRHARTDRDLVAKTLQRLRAVNPNVVGAVLNNVDIQRAYHKDYYYAGAYYYAEGASGTTRRRKTERKARVG